MVNDCIVAAVGLVRSGDQREVSVTDKILIYVDEIRSGTVQSTVFCSFNLDELHAQPFGDMFFLLDEKRVAVTSLAFLVGIDIGNPEQSCTEALVAHQIEYFVRQVFLKQHLLKFLA